MNEEFRNICLESKDKTYLKYQARFFFARNGMNLSLLQVQEATGIGHAYLARLEDGRVRKPSPEVMKTLCDFYKIDINTL